MADGRPDCFKCWDSGVVHNSPVRDDITLCDCPAGGKGKKAVPHKKGGFFRHYNADGALAGCYSGTGGIDPASMLPPTLRLKIRPGDTVEYLERDKTRAWVIVTTWDVITELVERAK